MFLYKNTDDIEKRRTKPFFILAFNEKASARLA